MSRRILVGRLAADALEGGRESAVAAAVAADDPAEELQRARLAAAMPAIVARLREAEARSGVLTTPDDELTAVVQSALAEHADETGAVEQLREDLYEAKYDEADIAGWLFRYVPAWLAGRFTKRPFRDPVGGPVAIPASARVAIFGDWGSGLYGAPPIARAIEAVKPGLDVVMHLGDVYYAGTKREVQQNMLDVWPKVPGAINRALNSNHEMYSGGEGYFDLTLNDLRFAGQNASCFALQNDRFLLLGLDTAYKDHDLGDSQVAWIRACVAGAAGRKVVLFSHHQPFSAYEGGGAKLVAKLGDLLDARAIFAWYWAHEHRCALFERHPRWGLHGRCVGHGGYPAFRDRHDGRVVRDVGDGVTWREVQGTNTPLATVLDGPNPYVADGPYRYAPNGYMTLNFDGDRIHELVHAANGDVILSRELR